MKRDNEQLKRDFGERRAASTAGRIYWQMQAESLLYFPAGAPAVNADDTESESKEMYRVTLFHKGDYEAQLNKTLEVLRAADVYINSVDAESYETETGYWLVPITIEILKE